MLSNKDFDNEVKKSITKDNLDEWDKTKLISELIEKHMPQSLKDEREPLIKDVDDYGNTRYSAPESYYEIFNKYDR